MVPCTAEKSRGASVSTRKSHNRDRGGKSWVGKSGLPRGGHRRHEDYGNVRAHGYVLTSTLLF